MKRLLFAAAAAVLLIVPLNLLREAAASDAIEWNSAPCIEPFFDGIEQDPGSRRLVLFGSASQCAPVVAKGGYRLATYYPDKDTGSAPGYNVRLFPKEEVGSFRGFGAVVVPNTLGTYGVCFLAGAEERVACIQVEVRVTGRSWYASSTRLDVNDKLVDKPVESGVHTGGLSPTPPKGPTGGCGTCF